MRYAEVAVDAPVTNTHTFSYRIPGQFSVEPGQLVWVPFGRRVLQGVVMELATAPRVEATRDILQAVEPSPLLSPIALELAQWLSGYYLCSLFDALAPMLPPGFRAQVRSQITSAQVPEDAWESLPPRTQDTLRALATKGKLSEAEFAKRLGRNASREVNRLAARGLVRRQVDLPRPKTFHYDCFLFPVDDPDDRESNLGGSGRAVELPPRQAQLLRAVQAQSAQAVGYPAALANKEYGQGVANALVNKALLGLDWRRVEAHPVATYPDGQSGPAFALTGEQSDAVERICQALADPSARPRSFLIHGVTGSGKTEVYLRAMQRVVEEGKQAILLVPEISLTPQTVERVSARFPGRVAVLHSRLKPREKFDQWWSIRDGGYDVVVGPRSALFAPVPQLGLVVIDEEHEWTYKQEEAQPLYHTRTAALELARLTGSVVVMGSATPDVETYYHALQGRHRLLELPGRIGGGGSLDLATVEICDMRQELREGNRSIFSRDLTQALKDCINRQQQAILFLNRRGSSPFVQCRDCGYVLACPSCSVSLTYHSTDSRLACHRCNRRTRLPRRCRRCGGGRIRQLGIGTQRVVEEVSQLLPGVQVDRWDADASRTGPGPEETMRRLASGETQVLVGTQMVAKGLDIPNVTLVGVVLADIGLHRPDFRAGERGFGLLCQVAGRAGRGPAPGRVIIQTYNPEHYAIAAAADQDYPALYQQEIQARHSQGNPPFNRLVQVGFQDVNVNTCQQQATALARLFRQKVAAQGLGDVEVIGPAPGVPERVRGHYRWHVLLRGRNLHRFMEGVRFPPVCTVNVDPAHVL